MDNDSTILHKISHHDGLTVPPDFFESFNHKLIDSLPTRLEAENPEAVILPPPTLWTRIRPYVYLAAMFAGIWCMLNMFSFLSPQDSASSGIDSNPILAQAIASDSFVNDFIASDPSQWELIDDLIDDGFSPSDLTSDYSAEFNLIDPASTSN